MTPEMDFHRWVRLFNYLVERKDQFRSVYPVRTRMDALLA